MGYGDSFTEQSAAHHRLYNFKQEWSGVLAVAARVLDYKTRDGNEWRETARRRTREKLESVYNPWTAAHGYQRCRWVEDTARAGLRFAGYVRPRRGRRDTADYNNDSRFLFASDKRDGVGWFGDEFQDSCFYAVVYRLPRGLFAYGYEDSWNNGAAFLAFDTCASAEDAEERACCIAKDAAQEEWEYRESERERESEEEE